MSSTRNFDSPITNAFRIHCGNELYERFVAALDGNGRHTSRLRFWQERLWAEFAAIYPHDLPTSPIEIAMTFGIAIPSKVLQWVQMKDYDNYVADLVQLPNGSRYLQPRRPDDEVTPHTVFTTCIATGRELRDCQTGNVCVRLTSGEKFAMDAHGIWMTIPEVRALFTDSPTDNEHPPWVNGLPPRFPPK
jgi:hypothetical protein